MDGRTGKEGSGSQQPAFYSRPQSPIAGLRGDSRASSPSWLGSGLGSSWLVSSWLDFQQG
jgi:hypothetical protein